jgi:hypothetical protein
MTTGTPRTEAEHSQNNSPALDFVGSLAGNNQWILNYDEEMQLQTKVTFPNAFINLDHVPRVVQC